MKKWPTHSPGFNVCSLGGGDGMRAGEQGRCALYFGGFACFCIEFKETNVSRKLIKERRRLLTIYFFSYCLFFIIIIVIHT